MRFLSVADHYNDPDSGAGGTVFQMIGALRLLGHSVDERWSEQLSKRRISHGNLHSLIEQPLQYRLAIRSACLEQVYDAILVQQPQSYLAALEHKKHGRSGLFLTLSQGVETRIQPIIKDWRGRLSRSSPNLLKEISSSFLQNCLARQWRLATKYSDGICVQHTQDKQFICQTYNLAQESVHVWASAVPVSYHFDSVKEMTPARLNRLLFVGQCAFFKGPDLLVQIINGVLKRNRSVTFTWVCADNSHAGALEMFDPDVRMRVQMRAWMPQGELQVVLDEHGIFVFPTIAEGFAKAPLEAMSRGLCVVASDCCGMADYIEDSKSGFLAAIGDVGAFAKTIDCLLGSLSLAEVVSESAREASLSFTWKNSATHLVDFVSARSQRR